jgi:hypothetical protein
MHCKNKEKNNVLTAPHCKQCTVVQDIHISRLELQRCPLEFVIFVFKVYICDLGLRLANSFWDPCEVTEISKR